MISAQFHPTQHGEAHSIPLRPKSAISYASPPQTVPCYGKPHLKAPQWAELEPASRARAFQRQVLLVQLVVTKTLWRSPYPTDWAIWP